MSISYILKLRIVSDNQELKNRYKNQIAKMNTAEYKNNIFKDSGFDLYTPKGNQHICPGETRLVNLEIQCAAFKVVCDGDSCIKIPTGFYMYPRSSISKTPLRLANNVGIIDSGYRGNLMCAFDNVKNDYWQQEICDYQRLVQICMPDLSPFTVEIVDELSNTERGAGGFGSTGF